MFLGKDLVIGQKCVAHDKVSLWKEYEKNELEWLWKEFGVTVPEIARLALARYLAKIAVLQNKDKKVAIDTDDDDSQTDDSDDVVIDDEDSEMDDVEDRIENVKGSKDLKVSDCHDNLTVSCEGIDIRSFKYQLKHNENSGGWVTLL